ncbi:MAG: transcription-repair coupling factor [Gammaproteobacteria bacterium]
MPESKTISPLQPLLPNRPNPRVTWGRLYGSSRGLAIARAQAKHRGLTVVLAPDAHAAEVLEQELRFFGDRAEILLFPDWETLPYDVFSPYEDIISQRLETLYRLPSLDCGVLIVPVATLMQRLAPRSFLQQHSLMMARGQRLDREQLRARLQTVGYTYVSQVMTHGEYAVRGSIIDLYPMGSRLPYRIDLFDDEIESIRSFDPEQQTSLAEVDEIRLLPAREFPTDEAGIKQFRQNFRIAFEGDPNASLIYREVSRGAMPAGIEYYLPLFFEQTETLFDYLPNDTLFIQIDDLLAAAHGFEQEIRDRYEQRRHDRERPLLPPAQLFISQAEIETRIQAGHAVVAQRFELQETDNTASINYRSRALPDLSVRARSAEPAAALRAFVDALAGRALFVAESAGRREHLLEVLFGFDLRPAQVDGWQAFLASDAKLAITTAPLEQGLLIQDALGCSLAVISEHELFGERVQQRRRRRAPSRDADAVIRNLTDLVEGAPVVHEEHGVGRYLGLQRLDAGGVEAEYLMLKYAGGDKLYVPVASLHLVSRYAGTSPENAPLHRLGGDQWQRIKRRAADKARDVAAELLEIYARRAARQGHSFAVAGDDYAAFADAFPFEETPDQSRAIDDVLKDMAAPRPMDRLVCGDVGFGKTEVAMRAAFVAVQNGRQVAVLVPTTLLAQQHYQTFADRFADWPVRIESLSRFQAGKRQQAIIAGLRSGEVDIVIGTHKLLQRGIKFKNLGLVVIDEEHRFGVRHKERLKALRAEVDTLALTATPIPRTLNMSLASLRELSIIATPPMHRHAIKTFVTQWSDGLIQEACRRELKRGGQVYFLHNEVETIERITAQARALVPDASVRFAHGQMRERELEQVMLDFYHQRFNVLVCTTIIESGIDVPSANTIIVNRADRLGLAQLHQLRGRVGRSHHRAYAYLIAPPRTAITADAVKRLEAIESLEDLGIGFTLATHDLEIRGAGELLGEDQSGQIQEIGFSLYNELLERAVRALRAGELPDANATRAHGAEVDLGVPALLPDSYVPDVHTRLVLYKRIASAGDEDELRELQVEMIDRFGLLPEYAKNLFEVTRLKLKVAPIGVVKLEAGAQGGRILFGSQPNIDPEKIVQLIQCRPQVYSLDGADRLRFRQPMADLEQRIEAISTLLNAMALGKAA